MRIEKLLARTKIIPVVTIENAEDALPVAKALIKGGINTVEITLRTEAAYEAIHIISDKCKKLLVGAGTVTTPYGMKRAIEAGAEFLVSPGLTEHLAESSRYYSKPFMPGVTTTSEVMNAIEFGFKYLKFFPAERAGGLSMLQSWNAIFKDTIFTPTGGIHTEKMQDYLAMDNVLAVGGTWIAPTDIIAKRKWKAISDTCKEALELAENE